MEFLSFAVTTSVWRYKPQESYCFYCARQTNYNQNYYTDSSPQSKPVHSPEPQHYNTSQHCHQYSQPIQPSHATIHNFSQYGSTGYMLLIYRSECCSRSFVRNCLCLGVGIVFRRFGRELHSGLFCASRVCLGRRSRGG